MLDKRGFFCKFCIKGTRIKRTLSYGDKMCYNAGTIDNQAHDSKSRQ
jgi:hypothetical protein